MSTIEHCPVCAGDLVDEVVEKLLHGGSHTGILRIKAVVCERCGERLYVPAVVRRFEEVRKKLEKEEIEDFLVQGNTYRVPDNP